MVPHCLLWLLEVYCGSFKFMVVPKGFSCSLRFIVVPICIKKCKTSLPPSG